MRRLVTPTVVLASLLAALVLAPRRAEAKHFRFLGGHPVAMRYGGGFCYIEAPHMHIYPPDHAPLYQQVGDEYVFTGDPTPFGYDGERHMFYGHHPVVTVDGQPVYCYIEGPHVHSFAPPDDPSYKVRNGVAFYVGPFTPAYAKLRPQRVRVVANEYRPYVAFRPTVEVAPPPEWQGEVWVAPPGPPSVTVSAPGVVVSAPPPPSVTVSAPGVYVAAPRPPHVVVTAPAPPSVVVQPPGVYVGAPGVVVGPPGVVVSQPGVYVRERRHGDDEDGNDQGHHDNGRHRGWYKNHRGDD
jgi:hypothetical protein